MSQLPLPKSTKNAIGDKAQEFIKAAEDFTKKRKDDIQTDIKHYSKDAGKGGNLNKLKIQSFTSGLKSMIGSFLAYKASEYLDKLLNGKFGALNGASMFGNLSNRFDTSKNTLSAMFMQNNKVLYDFIDYSRAYVKKRTRKATDYADRLTDTVNSFFDIYESLTSEELNAWVNEFSTFVNQAKDNFKQAKVSLSLYEDALITYGIANQYNKEKTFSSIDAGIYNLQGYRSDQALATLPIAHEDIESIFREFAFETREIETARSNHAKMPNMLDEVKIRGVYGPDILRKGVELVDDLISDIENVQITVKDAQSIVHASCYPWILAAESIKAILTQIDQDIEPPKTGPEYTRVVVVSEALEAIDILVPLKELEDDIKSLSKFMDDAYRKHKVTDLGPLRARIIQRISTLKTNIQTIEDSLQIPDELNPDVSYVIDDIKSSGFDGWIQALLSGDILGFLMAKFGGSTSAGQIITALQQLTSLGTAPTAEALFFYQAARSDLLKKENAARQKINVFEDILPDNLKMAVEKYDEKMERLRSSFSGSLGSQYGIKGF